MLAFVRRFRVRWQCAALKRQLSDKKMRRKAATPQKAFVLWVSRVSKSLSRAVRWA